MPIFLKKKEHGSHFRYFPVAWKMREHDLTEAGKAYSWIALQCGFLALFIWDGAAKENSFSPPPRGGPCPSPGAVVAVPARPPA